MKKRNTWVPVVAGLIQKQDTLLCGVRPDDKNLPGRWEFPGGKIELGELPEEALKRELKEELDIEAEVGPLVMATTHNYNDVGILLMFYHIHFWQGEPKTAHHKELQWIPIPQLNDLNMPDANKKVIPDLIKLLNNG